MAGKQRDALLSPLAAQAPPLLRQEDGTEHAPITWLFEPESFAPLAKLVGDERFSIVTDHLGAPLSMVDARGTQTWAADIDVYGGLQNVSGDRQDCPFRWPGQYEDAETGLYYNRFRYYDPESGQYVSQDPLGIDPALNSAAYILDPLVEIDPLGLWRQRRNNGQFAAKPGPKPKPSGHGNAKASNKPAVLYAMENDKGEFQKWGITDKVDNPRRRYGNSIPEDWSVNERARGSRKSMLELERELAEKRPGPLNNEPWAGKKKGQPLSKKAAKVCGS